MLPYLSKELWYIIRPSVYAKGQFTLAITVPADGYGGKPKLFQCLGIGCDAISEEFSFGEEVFSDLDSLLEKFSHWKPVPVDRKFEEECKDKFKIDIIETKV